MKKYISIVLGIGIFLRVLLSFSTYHSDTVPFDFAGVVLKNGNITNFYDYLWDLPDDSPILKVYPRNLFNYPPLPYFFLGGTSLLTTWIVDQDIHHNFVFDFKSTLGNLNLNLLLLLLKLPYFIFDIGIAYLLMKLFKEEKQKMLAFALWIFNPVTLYSTYMVGQFDVIPSFLTVGALYFATREKRQNLILSAVLLGIGAGFKIFPLLFMIPLALVEKSFWQRVKLILIAGLTYIISAYPFIWSQGFRMTAALANQTTKSFYAQIPISGGESVILFLAAVIFLYILFFYTETKPEDLWKRFFVMIITFFIFTHYHPQWFLWITPFFVIDLIKTKMKHLFIFLIMFFSWLGQISFFDPGLSVWLFSPIWPKLYEMPGIWQQIGLSLDINLMRSLLQTVFVGSAMYYIYYYFPRKNELK